MLFFRMTSLILIILTLTINLSCAIALESVRTQEIMQCLTGELSTWGDGQDKPAISSLLKFSYNPAGAPSWFTEQLVFNCISY